MKICIINHGFVTGAGQERVNYEIAHYLAKQGHEVFLIARKISPDFNFYPNVHTFLVNIPKWVKTAFLLHQVFAIKSRAILKQNSTKFEIVHANGAITYYPSDVNACHFVHSSWVNSNYHPIRQSLGIEGIYQWLYGKLNAGWEKRVYQQTQRVVAVSDFVKQSLVQDVHVTAATIDVVWNGVDIEEFRPIRPNEANTLRSALGLPINACISFFTGDIKSNRKNLDLVLQAFGQLPNHHHLVVAGAAEGSVYPSMAETLGLTQRVHFLGHRQDVSMLLRCADVFTFPSHYDPCPLVILEALASGVPVVTTKSVGSSALIQHGENGYILDGNYDLDGLVKILRQLGESVVLRDQVGQMGRQTAEDLSWQNMARQYELIYAEVYQKQRNSDIYPDLSLTDGSIQ
jgi:glycosyltransferase involved in cell wall biosynthesis